MPTLQLDDCLIAYADSGSEPGRDAPPVLLLHGLGSHGGDWRFVAPLLARNHRVLIPDMRGHGASSKPDGAYGVPLFARDVARFCDALGVREAHVVGLSMGGMIGFELAVRRPDLVRDLVVVNSGPDMVLRTLQLKLALGLRLALLELLGPRGLAKVLARKLFPHPEQAELRVQVIEVIGSNDKDTYRRATRGLIGWSVLDELSAIACPVLVLSSERDYVSHARKREYVDRLPDARLEIIEDSGHAAPLDQPERVAEHIESFLTQGNEVRLSSAIGT